MACAKKLLAARPRLYPQFATHNALTVAGVIEDAGGAAAIEDFEFQRLYGMGEALYAALMAELPQTACRVYAPVGGHRDLLAYLVRRLLENGANSSFVSVAADPNVPIADILRRPQARIAGPHAVRNKHISLPRDLYQPVRQNSAGIEFGDRASLDALVAEVRAAAPVAVMAAPLIDGVMVPGRERAVRSPIDGTNVGTVSEGDEAIVHAAMAAAQAGFLDWSARSPHDRALVLERAADKLEQDRGPLLALLQAEGGKTLDDAVAELREAVDGCRYYAAQARSALAPQAMPGPTGESNTLRYRGRGVFVCISPWNFPLAIFLGQIAAALAAGNSVVAKPAEQTPLVAARAVALMHAAGVPAGALHLVPGDGAVGASLVADPRVAGVAFTGSTDVGRAINRALAAKDGPIVPLIAETGGINAMIVDATALPEQVTDDVIASAFRSAGQRCSALRLLCLQDDIAAPMLAMLIGAARELKFGDPRDPATHIGPVIDADAMQKLESWIAANGGDRPGALPPRPAGAARGRYLRRPGHHRTRLSARTAARGVRTRLARRALARRRTRRAPRRHCGERHRAHARRPFAHRQHRRARRRAATARQCLRQPQHDRRRHRHPAVRRHPALRHRAEGRRSELSAPLCGRAGRHGQHGGGGRQCGAVGAG